MKPNEQCRIPTSKPYQSLHKNGMFSISTAVPVVSQTHELLQDCRIRARKSWQGWGAKIAAVKKKRILDFWKHQPTWKTHVFWYTWYNLNKDFVRDKLKSSLPFFCQYSWRLWLHHSKQDYNLFNHVVRQHCMTVSWNQGLWNRCFQRFKISAFSIPTTKLSHAHMYMSIYVHINTYMHRTFIHDIWLSFCHTDFSMDAGTKMGIQPNKTNMNMEKSNHLKMYPLSNNVDFPACHVRMPWTVEHCVSPRGTSGERLACQAMPVLGRLGRIRDLWPKPQWLMGPFFRKLVIFLKNEHSDTQTLVVCCIYIYIYRGLNS